MLSTGLTGQKCIEYTGANNGPLMVMVWARDKEKKMASRRKKLSIIRFLSLLAPKLFGLGSTLQTKKKKTTRTMQISSTLT